MPIWETAMSVGVMLIVVAIFAGTQGDALARGEAERNAVVMEELHEGVEQYLKHHYARLERCFDGVATEAGWESASTGGEVSDWKVLRLYPEVAYDHSAGGAQTLALDAAAWACDVAVPEWPDGVAPLAGSGFLPGALAALEYDSAREEANLYRGIDFRVAVRLVNLSRAVNAPRLGMQAVMVAVKRSGEAMLEREAGWMASAVRTGDVGLLRSFAVGGSVAESTIAGAGGAWSLTVCGTSGLTGLVACPAGAREIDVLELPGSAGEHELTRYLLASGGAGTQRPSGARSGTESAKARVVMVASLSRESFLSDVLYRVDIGIPEAQLMETDIDMGGFGLVNVTYGTGVDIDGDGLVDRGINLVGPGATPATIGLAGVAAREFPTRIHGDLHVTGNIKVGCDDFEHGQVTGRGRVWLCDEGRLQVGGGSFDSALTPSSVYLAEMGASSANVQAGGTSFELGAEQASLYLSSTAGAKAQLGGTAFDTNVTPASVYLAEDGRAQVGGAAFDTGVTPRSVFAQGSGRAQVGGTGFDTGLTAGSLFLEGDGRAQVGGAAFDAGLTARSVYLEGGGRMQVGGANFDAALTPRSVFLPGTGANTANLQAGGTSFGLGGEQASAFLSSTNGAKVQLGGAAFDASLSPRSLFMQGNTMNSNNLQLGGAGFQLGTEQQSVFARSGNGAKVQVGGANFDAGGVDPFSWTP